MAKVPRKLYKIGEVMEHSGLSRQTLHYYTVLGLLPVAQRTASRHRLYGEEVFEVLERIQDLKRQHTLEEIRLILQEDQRTPKRTPDKTSD